MWFRLGDKLWCCKKFNQYSSNTVRLDMEADVLFAYSPFNYLVKSKTYIWGYLLSGLKIVMWLTGWWMRFENRETPNTRLIFRAWVRKKWIFVTHAVFQIYLLSFCLIYRFPFLNIYLKKIKGTKISNKYWKYFSYYFCDSCFGVQSQLKK